MTKDIFTEKILKERFKIVDPEARIFPNGVIFISPGKKVLVYCKIVKKSFVCKVFTSFISLKSFDHWLNASKTQSMQHLGKVQFVKATLPPELGSAKNMAAAKIENQWKQIITM